MTPHNSAGNGSQLSTTVYVGSTSVTAPGSCFVSQSPNSAATAVTAGTTVSLSVNCSTGNAPTSCSWTDGIASTSCFVNVAPSATTSYSVVASNSGGSAPSASTTVNVSANTGGTPTGSNFCSGSDMIINVGWPASGQVRPQTSGFGNQRVAFRLTIPTTFSPALNISHLGFVHMAEVPGSPTTPREFTVSRNSCDFQSPGQYIYDGTGYAVAGPGVNYTVNNPTGYFSVGGDFNLMSGDVVYVNVRNSNNGVPACGYSACDMLFDFATPNRY